VDAIVVGEEAGVKARIAAFGFDLMIASFVVLFGYLARKRMRWAFVVGMILYALDGLLFLLAADFFSLAFHAFALFGIYGGFKACGQLKAIEPPEFDDPLSEGPMTILAAEDGMPKSTKRETIWPGVLAIFTFMYVVFYSVVSIGDWPNYGRLTGCSLLLAGIAGLLMKRKVAVKFFYGGAGVIILYTLYRFIANTMSSLGEVPFGAMIVLLIFLLMVLFWPSFLVVWFLRRAVREHVDAQWN
jgi:hypothetical protein